MRMSFVLNRRLSLVNTYMQHIRTVVPEPIVRPLLRLSHERRRDVRTVCKYMCAPGSLLTVVQDESSTSLAAQSNSPRQPRELIT